MVILIDTERHKEKNAKAYETLSGIIKQEIGRTGFKVFEYHPKELPIFYFYKNFLGKLLLGMDSEPLFVDGRPINPHIIVRDSGCDTLAGDIAEKYEQATGIEMRIIK